MTWAGKQSEQPRAFQSPETYLLLTFPFIERGYRTSENGPILNMWSRGVARWFRWSLSVAGSFVRVEESTTGCRWSLAVTAVSSFVPV